VGCCGRLQERCRQCAKWTTLHEGEKHHLCRACNTARKHGPTASQSSAPSSSSSPPRPLFEHKSSALHHLSEIEREAIVTMDKLRYTRNEIADTIPCNINSVGQWIRCWQKDHTLNDKDGRGRKREADNTTAAIIETATQQPFTTPKQIISELQLPLSHDTVRRRLDEAGLHGRVARAEYPFSDYDIHRRLSFAEGYASWSEEEWERVIFSDETHIEVWGRSRVWVQRPVGQAFNAKYFANRMPHSERVSLWGSFCARGIGQAEIFVDEFNAHKYVDVLQHNLIQTALHFYPNEHWWFQQDNAPQHTSHLAQRWFHNHGVDMIDFPPYSPDLSPIENLWSILKARIEHRLIRTIDEVERVLKEEWEAIDKDLLIRLAHSMPARCQAVVQNRGHKAPY
jgi:transposase